MVHAISHREPAQDCTARGIPQEKVPPEEELAHRLKTQLETIKIIGLKLYPNRQVHQDCWLIRSLRSRRRETCAGGPEIQHR